MDKKSFEIMMSGRGGRGEERKKERYKDGSRGKKRREPLPKKEGAMDKKEGAGEG